VTKGARRELPPAQAIEPELAKALKDKRQLQLLAENPTKGLASPEQLVAQLKPVLAKLPHEQGAAAAFALAEARQLIVKYRNQWLADPDKVRDARIGEIYDIPLAGTAVCVAIDRLLTTGGYSGLEPLLVIIDKINIAPPQLAFQPPPKTTFDYRVTAAPPDARCAGAPMLPFPELRNVGVHMKR